MQNEEDGREGRHDDEGPVGDILADSPPFDSAAGLHLMSSGDLEVAIGHVSSTADEWEDGGTTSREEAVRVKMLSRYRDDPDLLWRPHLVADDGTLARLDVLRAGAGNMAQLLDIVRRAAVISRHTRTPLRVPPIVLLGPPGSGKSRIAGLIAGALGTTSTTINCTSLQDLGPLLGSNPAWRGAGIGAVAKALLACPTSAPLLLCDEAEKASTVERSTNPLDCLLQLLEPTTAATFRDNYLDVPMAAQNALWLFCANSLEGLSRPLIDRCVVVEVAELSGDARRRALKELVADIACRHGMAPADLDEESLAVLDGGGLRRARAVVTAALAEAFEAGRDWPHAGDLRAAVTLFGSSGPRPRRPVGFVHF